ncbi:ribonuclease P protein component [Roseateles sp. YR242]|uniref:ribonuclease P protein component n=1 Tax=Roseateles sp. YR242 TaxID=1855305 RepID=UPI0008BDDD7F|nr:ribonuclease P protein component [Roseateles sp. YR242]SEL76220.1 ribonuclease P protein component [Roseateles sp. YR242]
MTGRIVRSADFERVLGSPSRARSTHFAVHHLAASPSLPARRLPKDSSTGPSTGKSELSTGDAQIHPQAVDEAVPDLPAGAWLGYVVPKRHARRAVTRTLLKRQIRQVFGTLPTLPPGLWVVRLRLPFDRKQFPSASSDALRAAAREELQYLIRKISSGASKPPPAAKPVPAGAVTGSSTGAA